MDHLIEHCSGQTSWRLCAWILEAVFQTYRPVSYRYYVERDKPRKIGGMVALNRVVFNTIEELWTLAGVSSIYMTK